MTAAAEKTLPVRVEAAPAETSAIVSMIERVARDPNSNIEKVREMLALRRQEQDYDAKRAYSAALSAMQPELPIIKERGMIGIGGAGKKGPTYALWEDINEAIKPVLAKHGFALSFRTGRDGDKIVVTGVLSHREGHSEETVMHLPIDTGPGRNAVQSVGSSTSYGKRYTASALLNLTSRGEDDDGATGGAGEKISEEQTGALQSLIVEVAADIQRFCKYMKVERIEEIPAKDYDRAVAALEAKRKAS